MLAEACARGISVGSARPSPPSSRTFAPRIAAVSLTSEKSALLNVRLALVEESTWRSVRRPASGSLRARVDRPAVRETHGYWTALPVISISASRDQVL